MSYIVQLSLCSIALVLCDRVIWLGCLVTERQPGPATEDVYLLSPFDGRPMTSSGSRFIGFKRLHGPEGARPPRDDIELIRRMGEGWRVGSEQWLAFVGFPGHQPRLQALDFSGSLGKRPSAAASTHPQRFAHVDEKHQINKHFISQVEPFFYFPTLKPCFSFHLSISIAFSLRIYDHHHQSSCQSDRDGHQRPKSSKMPP